MHWIKERKVSTPSLSYSINPKLPTQKAAGTRTKNSKLIKKNPKNSNDNQHSLTPLRCKENTSLTNIMINRLHSSLVGSDVSVKSSKGKQLYVMKKKHNKISNHKLYPTNQQQQVKRRKYTHQKNNHSLEEGIAKIVENRKKYNLSCCEMIQDGHSKSKDKKIKRKLTNKSNKNINKQKPTKKQPNKENNTNKSEDKYRQKSRKVSLKPGTPLIKSKGSTVMIGKEPPKNKKKVKANKNKKRESNNKLFVFSKSQSEQEWSLDEYPTNKYLKFLNKKQEDGILLNDEFLNENLNNFLSMSSGLIKSSDSGVINDKNKFGGQKQLIIHNYEIQPLEVDMDEIRFYQQRLNLAPKTKRSVKKDRHLIEEEISDQYPSLNDQELHFLSSVIFIQRKWREYRFSKIKNRFIPNFKNIKDLKQTRINTLNINQPHQTSISYGNIYQDLNTSKKKEEYEDKNQVDHQTQTLPMAIQPRTDRVQEKNTFLEKQPFPEVSYLSYKHSLLRQTYRKSLNLLKLELQAESISQYQYMKRKGEVSENFKKEIDSLKQDKHDIKKGYLRYIDCLNMMKKVVGKDSHYGIRKVSSQNGFTSLLYQKIYKFDGTISEPSECSDSIDLLAKKVLIRKQFFQQQNSLNLTNRGENLNLYQIHTSPNQLQSSQFQNELPVDIEEVYIPPQRKKRNPDYGLDLSGLTSSQQLIKRSVKKSTNLDELEKYCVIIEKQFLINLTIDLQKQLRKIDQDLTRKIIVGHSSKDISENKELEDSDSQESPRVRILNYEFTGMQSPRGIPTSPTSTRKYLYNSSNIMLYFEELVKYIIGINKFITEHQWEKQICDSLNKYQGIKPMRYLQFLRSLQLPPTQQEDYNPVISNENFISFQTYYLEKYQPESASLNEMMRHCKTVFHRCIFQLFLGELQLFRPYGEKGSPLPWQQQYSVLYKRKIEKNTLRLILQKCLLNIQGILKFECGVILEKHFYCNEQQLQKIHEDNEDRIIDMLEEDLLKSPHAWYELEEYTLEIRLNIVEKIEESLLMEVASSFYDFIF